MTDSTSKPPMWFWVVSGIALIWNAMGVMAYLGQAYMSDADLEALPEAEQALYTDVPAWATAAFAVAVFGGFLGAIALVIRKKWAKSLFLLSFIGIILQMTYNLFMSKAMDVYGPGGIIMPVMVIVIGIYLILFSNKSVEKGWLT